MCFLYLVVIGRVQFYTEPFPSAICANTLQAVGGWLTFYCSWCEFCLKCQTLFFPTACWYKRLLSYFDKPCLVEKTFIEPFVSGISCFCFSLRSFLPQAASSRVAPTKFQFWFPKLWTRMQNDIFAGSFLISAAWFYHPAISGQIDVFLHQPDQVSDSLT